MMAKKFTSVLEALLLMICICNGVFASAVENVIVTTKYGKIMGRVTSAPQLPGTTVTKIQQFVGIPFAAPPVGELRFKPPEPPQAWKPNTHDATQFGQVCIQKQAWLERLVKLTYPNFGKANYSEDCLYLNVYVPVRNNSDLQQKRYPVMIYIHGGAYVSGSSLLSPGDVLPVFEVILVTIQYRLGPFGFLSTGDSTAPGNYGMLDQVRALQWVKENIKSFGGDPSNVTIFGLSAGGASVGLHLLSPQSKDLFHKAISESGVDLAYWSVSTADVALSRTVSLGRKLGCIGKDHNKLLECIRKKDAWEIFHAGGGKADGDDVTWAPIVDSFNRENPFLPDTPKSLRQAGTFKSVPYMVGFTPNEAAYFFPQLGNATISLSDFRKAAEQQASQYSKATKNKELVRALKNAIEFQYTPWGETSDSNKLRQSIVDISSDNAFLAPSWQTCKLHSKNAPVYIFELNYRSKLEITPAWMGPTHAGTFIYDFGIPFLSLPAGLPSYNADDKNVSLLVMAMYTNFAKRGNPTPEPLANGIKWSACNSTSPVYLQIQIEPEMNRNFHPHRIAFWNEYYPTLMNLTSLCKDKPSVNNATRNTVPYQTVMLSLPVIMLTLFLSLWL